jgi:hypothetical protein
MIDNSPPILPRYPWKNQQSWFELMFEIKTALEEAEKKALQNTKALDYKKNQ